MKRRIEINAEKLRFEPSSIYGRVVKGCFYVKKSTELAIRCICLCTHTRDVMAEH